MAGEKKIITVGLCPCWDTVCRVDGIDWGDYLLAGFLAGLVESNRMGSKLPILQRSLELATQSATARAWGLTEKDWFRVKSSVEVQMKMI